MNSTYEIRRDVKKFKISNSRGTSYYPPKKRKSLRRAKNQNSIKTAIDADIVGIEGPKGIDSISVTETLPAQITYDNLLEEFKQHRAQKVVREQSIQSQPSLELTRTIESEPPPSRNAAQFLMDLILDSKQQEVEIGDLHELYVKKLKQFGKRRANVWFWVEIVKLFIAVGRRRMLKNLGLILVIEWVKRNLST